MVGMLSSSFVNVVGLGWVCEWGWRKVMRAMMGLVMMCRLEVESGGCQ